MILKSVHTGRPAFTLIEFLISVAICMILMAGLYFAVDIQTRSTKVGRGIVEEAMLARSVLDLVATDIETAVTINQPYRFRKGTLVYGSSSTTSSSSSSTGTSSGSTGSSGTSSTGTSGTGAGSTGTSGSSSSGSSGTGSSGTSSSQSSSGSSGSSSDSEEGMSLYGPALIPPGVVGFPEGLTLYIRKDLRQDEQEGQLNAGVQRITYGMIPNEDGGNNSGLGRWVVKMALSPQGIDPNAEPPEDQFELVAPEVKAIRFQFTSGDGNWVDQWDGRATGTDEVTPQGPPRAVRIEVDIQVTKDDQVQTFFRIVPIAVGNTPALAPPTTTTSGSSAP